MSLPILPPPYDALSLSPAFRDTFDGHGPVDPELWVWDTLDDALNRVGNGGEPHLRHAASYLVPDELGGNDVMAQQVDGALHMRCLADKVPNPHRENFTSPDGQLHPYADWRLYAPWLTTALRTWSEERGRHVTDPASPGRTFGVDSLFVTRVDFSRMSVPGRRWSLWPMPWGEDAESVSDAYDGDPRTGVELDVLEYDPAMPYHLSCVAIAGEELGNTPGHLIDMRDYGIDLTVGVHEIAMLWRRGVLVWFCDGVEILVDRERSPGVLMVLHMTCEMNSGVRRAGYSGSSPNSVVERLPGRPGDPGLFPPASVILGVDRLADDVTIVHEVAVYSVSDGESDVADAAADEPARPASEDKAASADAQPCDAAHEAVQDALKWARWKRSTGLPGFDRVIELLQAG